MIKSLDVIDIHGKKTSDIKLDHRLFDGKVKKNLVHEAVLMYQANLRIGSANTKTRKEVRGGGKKPWKQKGTGRARTGSIRNPLWRGGGITFGPKPRDFHYRLPKKALKGALLSVINDKLNDKKIKIVEKLQIDSHKTKDFLKLLKKLKLSPAASKLLIIVDSIDDRLSRATNNLRNIYIATSKNVNTYGVILAGNILIEKNAFLNIEKRLGK